MTQNKRNSLLFILWSAVSLLAVRTASGADAITHQITLSGDRSWCSDSMINGLFSEVNTFRTAHGVPALSMSAVGMKDAEIRATQFAAYMQTTAPGTPGFNPHDGYDTTAASLGYQLVSENLAYITTDPAYIVNGVWQDSLHLAALLATDANVMGVSCIYAGGTAYWTYEPGTCSSAGCGTTTPPAPAPGPTPSPSPTPSPTPTPTGTTALDSEESAFLSLLNEYRAQNGVGPLQVSVGLEAAAKWMSADMATNNYFSHTDSLGRSTGARLLSFGYSYSPWGENLAAGYSDAQSAFIQWQSACDPDASGACTYAHRKNMLGAGFTAIGIARASSDNSAYGWYWTTDFGGFVEQSVATPAPTPTPTPAPTPTPTAPVITSFSALPASIAAGQTATLSWVVTGATTVTIDNGIGNVASVASKAASPGQSTTYTLTATNTAGSSSAKVTISVTAAADTQAPTAPFLSSAMAASSTEVDLSWTASTDNVSVAGYQVLRNGGVLATVAGSARSYADATVAANASYTYSVRAYDAAGNISPASNTIPVATPAAPSAPGGGECSAPPSGAFIGCYYSNITLSGSPSLVRTDPQINFDWGGNTPDRAVSRGGYSVRWQGNFTFAQDTYTFTALSSDGMRLYIDGQLVMDRWYNQTAIQSMLSRPVSAGSHLITVEYYEITGWSVAHLTWQGATTATQTPLIVQKPSILSFSAAPAAVTAGQASNLTWSVNSASRISIDNGVGDVTGTSSKSVLPTQTTTYTLTASNAGGSSTAPVTVTLITAPDTQAPTAPVLVSAVANSSSEIDLVWAASADNVAVAGYQIVRNGVPLRSVTGSTLSFADLAVSPGGAYTYAVKAYDAAGNFSAAGNSIQVTPAATASAGSCTAIGVNAFSGCYYSNSTLSGSPALVRNDGQINFDWAGNPPDRTITRGGFSVRWQGRFDFAQGVYTFTALTSDGMRLYVDGTLVLDHWTDQATTQYTAQQSLAAGAHGITVEYYENTGWSSAHLSWQKM